MTNFAYILFPLITALVMVDGTPTPSSLHYISGRTDEICGAHNGRKLYMELGERGVLKASTPAPPGSLVQSSHAQCSLEIVTCPSCVLRITFRHLNLSSCSQDLSCRCDYVWITEPPYETSGTPFCGVSMEGNPHAPGYRSQTRIVNIALLFSANHANAFVLEYHAERNRQVLGLNPATGAPPRIISDFNSTGPLGGVLTSPFFPASYPRDLGVEYVITAMDPNSRVQILFTDFQVAISSIIEFYDWNNQRIDVTSGTSFRPGAIVSSGPSLLIRFYANGGTSLGYRATFTFISGSNKDPNIKPITDCGGFVENPGGAITMMHMAEDHVKHFDCIWIVKPPRNYFHLKTHLYLKIAQFSDFGGNTELVVRQGTTSQGVALETLRSPVAEVLGTTRGHKELVIPVDVGFYIALSGAFSARSKLAIIYAAFSYMDCFAGADFLCKNHRCISSRLSCDGFDHCGDGSDEPAATCFQDWSDSSALDRNWYSNTPNYLFPKMERYPDLKTATLVFLVSSLGLILLIVALIVLLYRMGARARQQRELQSRLQTISELLDGARIDEIVPDEPPTYEAPPDYEEVIKVGSGQSTTGSSGAIAGGSSAGPSVRASLHGKRRTKSKGNKQERRRAKSSPGVCLTSSSSSREVSLRVALPLSPPPHVASSHHRTSWPDTQGGSAPILLLARTLPAETVPDSPPPPYATDPSLAGSFCQEPSNSSSAPIIHHRRNQSEQIEPLLETFEDTFSGVLNQAMINSETEPAAAANNNNILVEDYCVPTSSSSTIEGEPYFQVCKLASAEKFDDIGTSSGSVNNIDESILSIEIHPSTSNAIEIQPSTSNATENFANFDEVGEYPSCASNKDFALNRCESSPNCSSYYLESLKGTDLQLSPHHELLDRVEVRSKSYEILQKPVTAVNSQRHISEPFFNENSKLLHDVEQIRIMNANLNFDSQIQQLKAQILEQNSKLLEMQKRSKHSSEGSSSDDGPDSMTDSLLSENLPRSELSSLDLG